ncbi:MAG TPA: hypothetical protein V6C97_34415 [Oculatellaceae cyanobacterium]
MPKREAERETHRKIGIGKDETKKQTKRERENKANSKNDREQRCDNPLKKCIQYVYIYIYTYHTHTNYV